MFGRDFLFYGIILDLLLASTFQEDLELPSKAEVSLFSPSAYQAEKQVQICNSVLFLTMF